MFYSKHPSLAPETESETLTPSLNLTLLLNIEADTDLHLSSLFPQFHSVEKILKDNLSPDDLKHVQQAIMALPLTMTLTLTLS